MKLTSVRRMAGIVVAGLLLAVSGAAVGLGSTTPGPAARAAWAFQPQSLTELQQAASDIVLARVAQIEPGPEIVVAAKGEPGGVDTVPTQRIRLQIIHRFQGQGASELTLFKTGAGHWYIDGDPPYQLGQQVLLYLRPRAGGDGTYLVVAPAGRYAVQDGRLVPVMAGGLAEQLRGKTLTEFASLLH